MSRYSHRVMGRSRLYLGYDVSNNTTLGISQRWFLNVGSAVKTASRAGTLALLNFVCPATTTAVFSTGIWDGTTFTVRDFESWNVVSGANSLPVSLDVQPGDTLAVFFSTIRNPGRMNGITDSRTWYSASTTTPSAGALITGWNDGGFGAMDFWATD